MAPFFLTDSIIEVEGKDIREVRIEGKGEVCVVRVCANLRPRPSRSDPHRENHKAHDSIVLPCGRRQARF